MHLAAHVLVRTNDISRALGLAGEPHAVNARKTVTPQTQSAEEAGTEYIGGLKQRKL